ncbi:MAG: hypothetical protein Q8J72_01030 [Rhodocyclaceae bacterium]|nr:hypothetical protein [Rhodocyclaceae bacterium]
MRKSFLHYDALAKRLTTDQSNCVTVTISVPHQEVKIEPSPQRQHLCLACLKVC